MGCEGNVAALSFGGNFLQLHDTACMGNIGPGLGMVGPTGNFSHFSGFSKMILSLAMLLGRLEIFPLFLMASPELYRSRHKKRAAGLDALR